MRILHTPFVQRCLFQKGFDVEALVNTVDRKSGEYIMRANVISTHAEVCSHAASPLAIQGAMAASTISAYPFGNWRLMLSHSRHLKECLRILKTFCSMYSGLIFGNSRYYVARRTVKLTTGKQHDNNAHVGHSLS